MEIWQRIGRIVSPLKRAGFWLLSRIHRSTRPRVGIICSGEVLLIRNWGDTKWSLPGGGMHRGESRESAAIREVAEEVGVKIPPDELKFVKIVEQKYNSAPVFCWKTSKKPDIHPQKHEITGVKWCTFEEISAMPTEVDATVSVLQF